MTPTKKELILAGLVFLAIPLFGEVALRVSHYPFEPQLYEPDRGRGWTLRPGAVGVVALETHQLVRINGLGFRDRERSYDKNSDGVRIALLGNSWTEALQVPLEKTYSAVLEQLLNECGCFVGKRVEVLNFGVAGYSTAQELLLLQQEVWKYHPDLVLVAFYSARDISNNVRELNSNINPEQSPYFVYDGEKLILDESFRVLPALQKRQMKMQKIRVSINERVRVLQAVDAMERFGKIRIAMAGVKENAEKAGVDNLEFSIYSPPSQPAMQQAWKTTEGLLLAIRDEVKAHSAELRIVTLPNRPQVIPDQAKRLEFMHKLGVADLSYADNRIRELGKREGIPVTNLAPALLEYAEAHHVYLNGFSDKNVGSGHWNEIGHRLAAEVIAVEMCGTAARRTSDASTAAH